MGGRQCWRGTAGVLGAVLVAFGAVGCVPRPNAESAAEQTQVVTFPPVTSATQGDPAAGTHSPAVGVGTDLFVNLPPLQYEPAPSWDPAGVNQGSADPGSTDGAAVAEAFAHHAVAVINHTQRQGRSAALRAISDPACGFCNGLASEVDALTARGLRRIGGELTFAPQEIEYQSTSALFFVTGAGVIADLVDVAPDGRVVQSIKGATRHLSIAVGKVDGTWRVFEAATTQDGE